MNCMSVQSKPSVSDANHMIDQLCTDPVGAGAAFLIGLFGSAHCLVMCGGITAAFSLSIPEKDRQGIRFWTLMTSASFGRVISYTMLGVLFGLLGGWLRGDHEIFIILFRAFAGVVLILMGLWISHVWRGIQVIEQLGDRSIACTRNQMHLRIPWDVHFSGTHRHRQPMSEAKPVLKCFCLDSAPCQEYWAQALMHMSAVEEPPISTDVASRDALWCLDDRTTCWRIDRPQPTDSPLQPMHLESQRLHPMDCHADKSANHLDLTVKWMQFRIIKCDGTTFCKPRNKFYGSVFPNLQSSP